MMELIQGILIALGVMVAFPMMRLVTTFFHEMGHAIPALISTKDIVEVHVGSYGEEGKAPNLQIGRLHFYLRFDVFNWNIGMCVPHGRSTWLGRLMTIIGGPIASTMICGVALFYMITQQSNPGILAAGIAMMILALIDLIVNLVPGATAYRSSEGEIQMSDGRQLVELFGQMGMSEQYHQVEALQHAGHHDQAIEKLRAMISGGDHNRKHYKLLIKSYLKNKNYQAVIDTYEQLVDHHSLVTDDYRTIGLSYLEVGNNTECVRCLNEYLYHNYSDSQANCARGLARMGLDQRVEALRDFQAAIAYSGTSNISKPLAHRGYLQVMLGDKEEGYADLQTAQENDPEGKIIDLQYYLAVYHEKMAEYDQALVYYQKAKELGYEHHGLEYKIYEMEERSSGRGLGV